MLVLILFLPGGLGRRRSEDPCRCRWLPVRSSGVLVWRPATVVDIATIRSAGIRNIREEDLVEVGYAVLLAEGPDLSNLHFSYQEEGADARVFGAS